MHRSFGPRTSTRRILSAWSQRRRGTVGAVTTPAMPVHALAPARSSELSDLTRLGVHHALSALFAPSTGTSASLWLFWGALVVAASVAIVRGPMTAETGRGRRDRFRWPLLGIQLTTLLLAFGTLTYQVAAAGPLTGFDKAMLDWMVAHRAAPATAVAIAMTEFAGPVAITVAAVGIGILWSRKVGSMIPAVVLIGTVGAAAVAETVTKSLVVRSRPAETVQVLLETDYSFPSGHATCSTALFVLAAVMLGHRLSTLRRRLLLVTATVASILVAVTRVYLGEHWLTDVIGGLLLGILAAVAGSAIYVVLTARHDRNDLPYRRGRARDATSLDAAT